MNGLFTYTYQLSREMPPSDFPIYPVVTLDLTIIHSALRGPQLPSLGIGVRDDSMRGKFFSDWDLNLRLLHLTSCHLIHSDTASFILFYFNYKSVILIAAYRDSGPVLQGEVIRTTSTPVHNVFVLTLAAQMSLPVGQVQVVIYIGIAELRVT